MRDIAKRLTALEAEHRSCTPRVTNARRAEMIQRILNLANDPAQHHQVEEMGGLTFGERAQQIVGLLNTARARMEAL